MRIDFSVSLGLVLASTLACELKGGGDTDSNVDSSSTAGSTDGTGTEGMSSGDPLTTSATSGDTAVTGISTASTSATSGDATGTSGDPDPTGMTSTSTTVGTSMSGSTSEGTTGEPVVPKPCEGPAAAIDGEALAYLSSQVPPMPDPTGGSSGSSGGEPEDPNTLHVRLSSQAATCADPSVGIDCGPNWEVSIRIPVAFQTPGLYHLSGPDVIGIATETGADGGGGECSFGGGSFFASFELIEITDELVTGRLCHIETPFFDNKVDLEGSFKAPRCQ